MDNLPQIWKVAANMLNKVSRTAVNVWSPKLVVERRANDASELKCIYLLHIN